MKEMRKDLRGHLVGHEFDLSTAFCLKCGIAMMRAVDTEAMDCPAAANVIAISHIISQRKTDRLLRRVAQSNGIGRHIH